MLDKPMTGSGKSLKTLAQRMAEFAFGLRYDLIPAEITAAARRHLADTLACALGARNAPIIIALRKHALAAGGRAEATILSTAEKVPSPLAALVNGAMVRYLDANDIFVSSRGAASGHFSDATAGLLAVAEQYRHSGEELLTCIVAAYELQGALAEAIDFWERGLHPVTNVAWVVPIVAARLIGATPDQAVHGCGLAVATGTVLNSWIRPAKTIPMIKSVAVGLALQRALEAANLAALGVTATDDALETVLARPSQPSARFDPTPIENLGRHWSMKRNMLKLYPAQINTQPAIEATIRAYQCGIRAEHVRKLVLYGHRNLAAGVQGSAGTFTPANRESADHSTPYVMAMALLRGRLTLEEFEKAPWQTAAVRSLMKKIELVVDQELDEAFARRGIFGARLTAELNDGRVEEIIVRQLKGHPDIPLSDAELSEKTSWLLKASAPNLEPHRLLDLCSHVATIQDMDQLVKSCQVDR